MKRFTYRFDKILGLHRHREKEKQRDLAAAQLREKNQVDYLKNLATDRERHRLEERGHLTGRLNPVQLTNYSRYYLKLKALDISGRQVLKKITEDVSRKRDILLGASRKRKTFEKLKERLREKYNVELNRQLQRENDDIGQKIFMRPK